MESNNNIRILNGSLLFDENLELIEEGFIVIENGKIVEIGDGFEKGGEVFENCLIMSSLINSHVHLGDSFAKDSILGMNVRGAVGKKGIKWKLYKTAKRDEIIKGIQDSILYMTISGTTSFAEFREFGLEGLQIFWESLEKLKIGVKPIVLAREIKESDPKLKFHGFGLNLYHLESIDESFKKLCKDKFLVVHAGECPNEVSRLLDIIDDANIKVDAIVHATKATDCELEEISKRRISVILCPRSNLTLRVGIPNVAKMLEHKINVCLGTDNVMITPPNMFRELEFLSRLIYLQDPDVSSKEILKIASVNPAKLFDLDHGTIKVGNSADLIIVDMNSVNLRNTKDMFATIATRVEPFNIKKIIVNGEDITLKI